MNVDQISVISLPDATSDTKSENNKNCKRNDAVEKDVSYWNICYLFAVLAFCAVSTSPITLIPRSNSIFYQSHWFEFNLPGGIIMILGATTHFLEMVTFFNEKSLRSIWIFLKMSTFRMMLWIVTCVISYIIWCSLLDYNWPIPFLGCIEIFISKFYLVGTRQI